MRRQAPEKSWLQHSSVESQRWAHVVQWNIKCVVQVMFYSHTFGGNKLKVILSIEQEHQPFQTPHRVLKGPSWKAAWVESKCAQLLRTAWALSSERLVQCYPEDQGSAQQFPEMPCPRCHPFRGCSLCCSVFYGQFGPIKHLLHSAGAFLLTPVGFGSIPTMVCSKSDADIFKLQRWKM